MVDLNINHGCTRMDTEISRCSLCLCGESETFMATQMDLLLAINALTEANPKMAQLWSTGLTNNTDKLVERIGQIIPDEVAYLTKMAEPALQEYRSVIDPAFISRKGRGKAHISNAQGYKLKKGWSKYERNRTHMFETVDGIPAKRYKDKVAAAKDNYSERVGETTLALTGMKVLESGPARTAGFWLTGDAKARGLMRKADKEVQPSVPFCVTWPANKGTLRQVLNSNIIRSGIAIIHSSFDASMILSENDRLNHLVQSMVDPATGLMPFATGAESHLDFVKQGGQMYLSVKVTQI